MPSHISRFSRRGVIKIIHETADVKDEAEGGTEEDEEGKVDIVQIVERGEVSTKVTESRIQQL